MCQPIDVGIGKPLKTRCRHLWEEWMVEEVTNNPTVACRPASRLQMSEWIHMSFNELKESNIGYNSWRHHDYSYFPNEPARAAIAADIGLFDILEAEADVSDNGSDNGSSETELNISSDEVAGEAVMPTVAATALQPAEVAGEAVMPTVAAAALQPAEQQPVRRRDPGWDDTDDSNYVPGTSESE